MTSIENLLLQEGPMLSGTLKRRLQTANVSDDAIRKRLSRLKSPVFKLNKCFTDNQSFFYHKDQFGTIEFYDALINAFESSSQRYFAIVQSVKYHYGFIEKSQLASYSFSPVQNLKSHKSFNNIINDLIGLKILIEEGDYYTLTPLLFTGKNENHARGLALVKNITLNQFNSWAQNINLIAYEKGTYHTPFTKFQWAFVAPSYISSLVSRNKETLTPGFVIADILLSDEVAVKDVNFYINKLNIVKSQKSTNILPFLLVDRVDHDTLILLKKHGITIGFIDRIFGYEYAQLLKSIVNMLDNAGAILKANPDQFIELLNKISKLVDSKTNNLRGDIFELAVGYYYSSQCQYLDIGKKIIFEAEKKEIDVFCQFQDKIVIVECKGYKSRVNRDEVETWAGKKIPVIYSWINSQQQLRDRGVVFEFWSTGGFSEDALEFLNDKSEKVKKYKINFYDHSQIMMKAKEMKATKFLDIMNEYFNKEVY